MPLPFLQPAGGAGPASAALPAGASASEPDAPFRYRGLYVESKWGPDLMTRDDWRALIDEMAWLGMNSLGIGVYGCWVVQYDGKRTEFLMVPFPDHPRLQTPKMLRWYSPAKRVMQELTYLPRMFEQDFFGQIVAYGRERGVAVRPHFNGPGHSTLIPAVYPEVSAKDERGVPSGFGYCLSSERTYELLFSLYDSLIERHLRPNGGVWWHIGLDEVNPYAGIDEADPQRVVDPWCRCAQCAKRTPAQLIVDFAVRTIRHLVEQGIEQITLWNDALSKLQAYSLFVEALTAAGLQERVAVQWWRYNDVPLPVGCQELRSWVTPMAGYWSNLMHHEYGPNIQIMALEGLRAGSEGLDAYCIYDPAFLRNYACLAAFGQEPDLDLASFRAGFDRWLFEGTSDGHSPEGAPPAAFAAADLLFDSNYGPFGTLLDSLLRYWWTYPAQRHVQYPRDQVLQLATNPLRLRATLTIAQRQAEQLRDACRAAAPRAADARRQRLLSEYACEAGKLAGVTHAFLLAAGGWEHYRRAQQGPTRAESTDALTRAQAAFQSARQAVEEVMAELERTKAAYLQPSILRDLTPLYEWLEQTHVQVRSLREQVEAGGLDELPPL